MYKKQFSSVVFAMAIVLASAASSSAAHVYTLEGLTLGDPLAGQDNWINLFGTSGATVETGTGVNTTNVAEKAVSLDQNVISRTNDGSFSFHSLVATDSAVVYRFDARSSDIAGTSRALMGFGNSSFSRPSFGFNNGNFYVRAESPATEYIASIGGAIDNDDWVRFQLSIDLTANGGDGSGSLAYQNLTDGDTGFTNVAGLLNLNLEIATDVTTWNVLRLDLRGAGATVQADNLQVSAIPEPSSLLLTTFGLIAFFARRNRS